LGPNAQHTDGAPVRIAPLQVSKGDTVIMMNTGKEYTLDEVGVLAPGKTQVRYV
jgi:translation elongation factor EF-4